MPAQAKQDYGPDGRRCMRLRSFHPFRDYALHPSVIVVASTLTILRL